MTFPEKFLELSGLNKLKSIKLTMGNSYLIAWAHRISGLLLLVYVLLHVNTLSSLADPEVFTGKAELFSSPVFLFFEWLLAAPVIFHCLNGGRLLAYELFTTRYDKRILRWICGLSCIYLLMLGYFMILSDQSVSPHFYWLCAIIISLVITYPFAQRIKKSQASIYWKLQRLTAAFLFTIVPAHMLFMHLNHRAGRDVQMITERLQQPLIIVLDILLLLSILYHGGYGLIGIGKDYLADRRIVKIGAILVIIVLALFALQGIMLIGSV